MNLTQIINLIFNKFRFLFLLLFIGIIGKSQEIGSLKGQIINQNQELLSDVHVLNVSKGHGVVSDQNGFYSITVNTGDSIHLFRIDYRDTIFVITPDLNMENEQRIILVKRNTLLNALDLFPKRPFLDTTNREGGEIKMSLPFRISGFENVKRDYSKFVFSGLGVAVRIGVKTKQKRMKEELTLYKKDDDYLIPFIESFDSTFFTEKLKIPKDNIINFVEFFARNPEVKKRIQTENSYYFIRELQDSAIVFLNKNI